MTDSAAGRPARLDLGRVGLHRPSTPIWYDNHGGGFKLHAATDLNTPAFAVGPAFSLADIDRSAKNNRA